MSWSAISRYRFVIEGNPARSARSECRKSALYRRWIDDGQQCLSIEREVVSEKEVGSHRFRSSRWQMLVTNPLRAKLYRAARDGGRQVVDQSRARTACGSGGQSIRIICGRHELECEVASAATVSADEVHLPLRQRRTQRDDELGRRRRDVKRRSRRYPRDQGKHDIGCDMD
jgi:hypothetical protein